MEENNRKKIAMIARTTGLEYDDRIRKECITLSKKAEIKIFVNLTSNRKEKGVTSYGIPFESIQLKTRDVLPSGKFLFIKSLEYYLQVRKRLKEYDLIWAHEVYTYIFPLLGSKGKYIWDQHEIPERFQKPLLKKIFHIIEKKCLYMIHANKYRISYLDKEGLIQYPSKHLSVNNYPDGSFRKPNSDTISDDIKQFRSWLNGDEYVYVQGVSKAERYPYNTIASILESTELKVLVVGGYDKEALNRLKNEYGVELDKRVFFKGMVDQLKIPFYLKNSSFTIVLYDILSPNTRYCEPNRLYQALSLGVPTIVGCNEPMKDLIENNNFGVAISGDGSNIHELKEAIYILDTNKEEIKKNILAKNNILKWESQEEKILNLI